MTQQRVSPISVTSVLPATPVLTLQAALGQSANIFEVRNSSGTIVSSLSSTGSFTQASGGAFIVRLATGEERFSIDGVAGRVAFVQGGGYVAIGHSGPPNYAYPTGSGKLHIQTSNSASIGAVIQGVTSQTANLTEWQNSAATVTAHITSNGAFRSSEYGHSLGNLTGGAAWGGNTPTLEIRNNNANISGIHFFSNIAPAFRVFDGSGNSRGMWDSDGSVVMGQTTTNAKLGTLTVYVGSASTIGSVIRAASSQTANLLELQNNSGTILARFNQVGSGIFGDASINAVGNLNAFASAANVVPFVVRGAASQSTNLSEWQNSAGTIVNRITFAGQTFINGFSGVSASLGIVQHTDHIGMVINQSSSNVNLVEHRRSDTSRHSYIDDIGRFNGTVLDSSLVQSTSAGSVLANLPAKTHPAEALLKEAVWWIDAGHSTSSSQTIRNLGWGGSVLDVTNGSSASADSNDAQYLAWDGINYVYLPGLSNNYLSTPDTNDFDVTGDIDIRVQVAADDWTPASAQILLSKWDFSTQNSFRFFIAANARLQLDISTLGTDTVTIQSSAANSILDGNTSWVRVTRVATTGVTKFFTSTDGLTWTQLGTDISSTASNMFASTTEIQIGATVATSANFAGKIYRAQLLNGIDGTPVLDIDTSTITSGSATSFRARTGQTITINRSTTGKKTACVVNPIWLFGTDDYMEVNNRWLEHLPASENYVYLNGVSGNSMSTPDAAALDITGDIDIRVKAALNDWTPGAFQVLANKWSTSGNFSYTFYVNTSGSLSFAWSPNGISDLTKSSTVSTGIADGATKWVRATLDVDNGASGNDVKFWLSDDGITWTQLGSTVTTVGVTSIYSGTASLEIGIQNISNYGVAGKIYRAQIYNGIAGTLVFDADASVITNGTASTFKERSTNAATVTINKSGIGTFASTNNYLYLPGVQSNFASVPDSAVLDITGDIDLRAKVALDDWTPSSVALLISKEASTNQLAYRLYVDTTGKIGLLSSSSGSAWTVGALSSVAPTVSDGAILWVRATLDVDNGASGNSVIFYTSTDGANWTQLGTTVTTAGVTSIFNSTQNVGFGARFSDGLLNGFKGKFFRAQIFNGINGTLALDANFESSIISQLPATITESSANAATVTISYSGTGYQSCGVTASTYVLPGSTNTFRPSTYSLLDFSGTDNFTLFISVRPWANIVNNGRYLNKFVWPEPGYSIQSNGVNGIKFEYYSTVSTATLGTTTTKLMNLAVSVNRSSATAVPYINGVNVTSISSFTTNTLANFSTLLVGRDPAGSAAQDFEFNGAAIWRRTLSNMEIDIINNYYQGRLL